MTRTYYGADDLRGSLDAFEAAFNLPSADFYAAYLDDDEERLEGIPGYHRFSWAAFYDDWRQCNGNHFAAVTGRNVQTSA